MAKFSVLGRKKKEWRNKTNIASTLMLDVTAKDSTAAKKKFEKDNDKYSAVVCDSLEPKDQTEEAPTDES